MPLRAVPVIAAVDGAVIGGGVCVVACCDIMQFEDSAEARSAFFGKREPEWKWR